MKKLMKKIPALALILVCSVSFAQKGKAVSYEVPQMPVSEETKLVSYNAVVDEKASKDELYKRAMNFFRANYKNPTDVIKKQDEAGGEIEGIARFKLYNPEDKKGLKTEAGLVSYTINLKLKDGKYRYEITKINWKQTSYYGIEKWMDKTSPSYQASYDYYLLQTDEQMKELTEKLTSLMKVPSEKEKKSDW